MTSAIGWLPQPVVPPPCPESLKLGLVTDRDLLAAVLQAVAGVEDRTRLADALSHLVGGARAVAEPEDRDRYCAGSIGFADTSNRLAAFEVGRRVASPRPARGGRIRSAADVAVSLAGSLAGLRRERVVVLVCDAADQLIGNVIVCEGALDRAMFPVREILHAVLVRDGRSFAVAHNHPSGDPEPSSADVQATRAIRDAARVVGLRFLGHVIVVEDGWREVS